MKKVFATLAFMLSIIGGGLSLAATASAEPGVVDPGLHGKVIEVELRVTELRASNLGKATPQYGGPSISNLVNAGTCPGGVFAQLANLSPWHAAMLDACSNAGYGAFGY